MLTLTNVMYAALTLAGYVLFALSRPLVTCPRCRGRRMVTPKQKNGKPGRPRKCRMCKGNALVRLPGAVTVHRLFWNIAGDSLRERRRQAVKAHLNGRKETHDDPRPQAPEADRQREDDERDRS